MSLLAPSLARQGPTAERHARIALSTPARLESSAGSSCSTPWVPLHRRANRAFQSAPCTNAMREPCTVTPQEQPLLWAVVAAGRRISPFRRVKLAWHQGPSTATPKKRLLSSPWFIPTEPFSECPRSVISEQRWANRGCKPPASAMIRVDPTAMPRDGILQSAMPFDICGKATGGLIEPRTRLIYL
jgi:hypothetical protein